MRRLQQIILAALAVLSITIGIGLIMVAGLPERADYTGNLTADLGYVAPEISKIAPPFTLTDLAFETVTLHKLPDKPIIINFWATWCVPCRIEMAELQDLYDHYDGEIHILGINLGESPQAVAQWKTELALSYELLIDPLQTVSQLYQIRGQPSTYVLDTHKQIQNIYYGPVSMEQLESDINTTLNPR